jgi:hypothetical protein
MPGTGLGGGGSAGAVGPIVRTRDEDASKPTNWATQAGQAVHSERFFYTSDFRGNASAIVSSGGNLIEQYRYSATGVPFGIARGDVNADGVVGTPGGGGGGTLSSFTSGNNPDLEQATYLEQNNIYEVRADWNLDGVIDSTDTAVAAAAVGTATGRKTMSAVGVRNRLGTKDSEEDVAGIYENVTGDTLVRSTMKPLNGKPFSKRPPMLRPVGGPGAPSYSGCVAACAASFGWFGDNYEKCVDGCAERFRTRPDIKPENWGNCGQGSYGNCWDWASNCPEPTRQRPGDNTGHMPSGVQRALDAAMRGPGPCVTPPDCATLIQGTMGGQGITPGLGGAAGCPYGYNNIRIIVKVATISSLRCDQTGPVMQAWMCETLVDIHFQRGNGAGGYTECSGCGPVGSAPNPAISKNLPVWWINGGQLEPIPKPRNRWPAWCE